MGFTFDESIFDDVPETALFQSPVPVLTPDSWLEYGPEIDARIGMCECFMDDLRELAAGLPREKEDLEENGFIGWRFDRAEELLDKMAFHHESAQEVLAIAFGYLCHITLPKEDPWSRLEHISADAKRQESLKDVMSATLERTCGDIDDLAQAAKTMEQLEEVRALYKEFCDELRSLMVQC